MEQLFFAGKAYLKINSLVKTPLHEFMAVERSGLWAPGSTQIPNCKHRVNSQTQGNKFYGEPHRLHGITVLNCFISLSIYLFYLAISINLIYLF